MERKLLLFLIIACLSGCTDFEYSPQQTFDSDSPRDLNKKNYERLLQAPVNDTLRFIVCGDSQASQNEVELFVKKANELQGLDLVFLAGDISDFGSLQEMEWLVRDFQNLKAPYFAVIGNHDLLGKGADVFKRMFGDLNYSFSYGGVKFVCHDTNGREYKFNGTVPDVNWLQTELIADGSVSSYIALAHVRPYTADFDPNLSTLYTDILNANPAMLASFYAHDHSFGEYHPNNSRIPFIVATSLGERGFLLVEIINGRLTYERIDY
ncbi:metallophosphoesterase [Flavihumibacter sp. R14]|nr:metallophosphoesterase [Flavihumibacter soli]